MPSALPLVWMTVEREKGLIRVTAREEESGRTLVLAFTLAATDNLCTALRSVRACEPKQAGYFDFGTHCRIDWPPEKTQVA